MSEPKLCHDCHAKPGELHSLGCDVERCPCCGGQSISCDCIYVFCGIDPDTMEELHPDIFENGPTKEMHKTWDATWESKRQPWTGEFPGKDQCREFGWYCKMVKGVGLVRCDAADPEATEDLNRLAWAAVWDAENGGHVNPNQKETHAARNRGRERG